MLLSVRRLRCASAALVAFIYSGPLFAADGNRLTYLDDFCNPYYVGVDFPKLTTPQWVGEEGVDAVITLGIDDMRDPARYEAYLRPILERLKQIDGRAPVSIMTCNVDPEDPQLQAWLEEGLSLETHTIDHPCPCLHGGDFDKAKSTYDRCVDLMHQVPNSRPVAFRFPCCDSLNTPSPRAFAEIMGRTTPQGNFLQLSSSVCSILTSDDSSLPRDLVLDADGRERFAKYVPFESFVNKVYNYPYPFVVGRLIWEFPCAVPDDWQAQNLQQPQNPKTLADMQAVIDAAVLKKGTANFVFHPYDWIRSDQMAALVDYADKTYGKRVKFLTFRECVERLNENLLAAHPLRAADGGDNGVRLLDVNNDGYLDVIIGNENVRVTRVWDPQQQQWRETEFPVPLVEVAADGVRRDAGVRFGVIQSSGVASILMANSERRGVWHFQERQWRPDQTLQQDLMYDNKPLLAVNSGIDQGLRLRDVDQDGIAEIIVANNDVQFMLKWDARRRAWHSFSAQLPAPIVDEQGRDAGLRFVDVNADGHKDIVFSNESRYAVHLFDSPESGWSREIRSGPRGDADSIPMIVRAGTNNGAWFAEGHMWLQNEDTHRLPDGVDRRSFAELLGTANGVGTIDRPNGPHIAETTDAKQTPEPLSPDDALKSLQPRPGFTIALVAAEPLVMDPVAFDWGPDGKLWVVEMADYPLGIDDQGEPGGRVRFLEDTDGDGIYDKSTLFLDGVPFPTGVMAWRKGVLVTAAPDIFYAEDTDGDGRADHRQTLYRGFGEGNQQHRVNGFEWGLDNWIYVANGDSGGRVESIKSREIVDMSGRDVRIRPDEGLIETVTGESQFGRRRDDWGNWFGNNNIVPLRHFVIDDAQLRRNPYLASGPVHVDIARADNTQLFPISRVISHWVGYTPPRGGETHRFTSACSTSFYRDDLFGPDFTTSCFTSEPIHNLVHRRVCQPQGVTFTSQRAADEQATEFLASTDSWFRPTMVRTGPDGALWIADMYRFVLEHPEWIDDEHEKGLFLRAGHDRGRIYRVVPADKRPRPIPHLGSLTTSELVAALDSPNGWTRDTAQRLLIERNDAKALEPLTQLQRSAERPLARLHALCTLNGMNLLQEHHLQCALHDNHAGVRRHAVRLAQSQLHKWPQLGAGLLDLAGDADPFVQLQVAYALGEWDDERAGAALGRLALEHAGDTYLRTAALSSLNPKNVHQVASVVFQSAGAVQSEYSLQGEVAAYAAAVGDARTVSNLVVELADASLSAVAAPRKMDLLRRVLESLQRRSATWQSLLTDDARDAIDRLTRRSQDLVLHSDDPEARLVAIGIVSLSPSRDAHTISLLAALLDPLESSDVQSAALTALGRITDSTVALEVLDRFGALSPSHRRAALDMLLSRTAWTEVLLDRLERGTPNPAEIGAAHRQRLTSFEDARLRARAVAIFEGATTANRGRLVEKYQAAPLSAPDVSRGQSLFVKHCANCHRADGVGHDVGPPLAALTDRSPLAILTAVLDPNRAVEDKYLSYLVQSADGKTHTGVLVAETGTAVTLRGEEGKDTQILRREMDDLRSTGQSLMPEGLEKELTPQDLADVAAYVARLGPEPKVFAGNRPQIIRADAAGVITLTAADCRIYGSTLVFEEQHHNLGYWQSADDYAEWTIEVPQEATYNVTMRYACDNSTPWNAFVLQIGEVEHVRDVPPTGTWSDYRHMAFRETEIPPGTHRVVLRAHGRPDGFLMDFQELELRP